MSLPVELEEAAAVLEGFANEELQQRLRAFAERKRRADN